MNKAESGRRARATSGRRPARAVALRLGSIGLALGTWWALAAAEIWSPLILPSPPRVWDAFVLSVTSEGKRRGLAGSYLWEHLEASVWRIGVGLFWAMLIGPIIGLLLASSRTVRAIFEPWVSFLRSLPPLGYFTILIFWFGIKDTSKIWLLFLAAFPPITLATMHGVQRVRRDRIDAARSLGGSRLQVVQHIVLPSALPDIFTGVRVAIGFAWTTIVAAETVNGLPGIGGLAWFTKKETRIDIAVMCVIVIGITAIALDQLVQLCERIVVPWKAHV